MLKLRRFSGDTKCSVIVRSLFRYKVHQETSMLVQLMSHQWSIVMSHQWFETAFHQTKEQNDQLSSIAVAGQTMLMLTNGAGKLSSKLYRVII